jgi:hypothetical protein
VLIHMVADLTVNAYTTTKFMRNKTFCQEQYRQMSESCEDGKELSRMQTDKTPLNLKKPVDENEEEAEV